MRIKEANALTGGEAACIVIYLYIYFFENILHIILYIIYCPGTTCVTPAWSLASVRGMLTSGAAFTAITRVRQTRRSGGR